MSDVQLTFLGTGASGGTPGTGRSARRESSLLLEGPARALIDATRHFGEQRGAMTGLDGVLLTHAHRDAAAGFRRCAAGGRSARRRHCRSTRHRRRSPCCAHAFGVSTASSLSRSSRASQCSGGAEAVAVEVRHARERRSRTYAWRLADGTTRSCTPRTSPGSSPTFGGSAPVLTYWS